MQERFQVRSPLAMVVLALLLEAPMHAYRMQQLIKERAKDTVVNVAQRNSVYQAIAILLRKGLIRVDETSREGGRPERTVYQVTEEGTATFYRWLRSMLSTPGREFPIFPAALAFLMMISPDDAIRQLSARMATLKKQLAESRATFKAVRSSGLPRLFLLEDEYRQSMLRAEIDWLSKVIADLRSKELSWSKEWIRKVAQKMEAQQE
jgi:DNA-binding PadR family transcriptional regulator